MLERKVVEHFQKLYDGKADYLWGAKCELITKVLTDKLFSWFGSKDYPKSYYDNKLAEGIGRIGADCPGAFKPVSGRDMTARDYYHFEASGGIMGVFTRSCVPCVQEVFVR
jgi:hypothetical protein